MKRIIRQNICTPYSLHDQIADHFEFQETRLIMHMKTGLVNVENPEQTVQGYIQFERIDPDFCYAYIINDVYNEGPFTGEKMLLMDYSRRYDGYEFEIIDEVFGYNITKFSGWLRIGETLNECIIEIYHFGDMIYVEN